MGGGELGGIQVGGSEELKFLRKKLGGWGGGVRVDVIEELKFL